jgi:hypothetical protein
VPMVEWNGVGSPSVEHLDLVQSPDGYRARSIVDLGPERIEYAVDLAPDWTFAALVLRSSRGRRLDIARHDGAWTVDTEPRPDLDEAVDIDLSFSPFTNTLPVRRLSLADGESADIVTAYVEAGSFRVSADPQRYTRLAVDRYRYESRDSDFVAELTVDADGLVIDYPGLFTRAPP